MLKFNISTILLLIRRLLVFVLVLPFLCSLTYYILYGSKSPVIIPPGSDKNYIQSMEFNKVPMLADSLYTIIVNKLNPEKSHESTAPQPNQNQPENFEETLNIYNYTGSLNFLSHFVDFIKISSYTIFLAFIGFAILLLWRVK